MVDKNCHDCYFADFGVRGKASTDGQITCDYLAKTGERRGCPSGSECTKKMTKAQWRAKRRQLHGR